ncbi:MAG: hypothetical protein S4CHLAM102_14310 [Chlamydiia bacterium]|nr:hypothetical protein [Chlamydiia bacterium]
MTACNGCKINFELENVTFELKTGPSTGSSCITGGGSCAHYIMKATPSSSGNYYRQCGGGQYGPISRIPADQAWAYLNSNTPFCHSSVSAQLFLGEAYDGGVDVCMDDVTHVHETFSVNVYSSTPLPCCKLDQATLVINWNGADNCITLPEASTS